MASISKQPNGRRIIQFTAESGKRYSIRLGKISQRNAEAIKARVENIVAAKRSRQSLDADTAAWLGEIDDSLHAKFANVGLAEARGKQTTAPMRLGEFLDYYFGIRTDVKPLTLTTWKQTRRLLVEFFGNDRLIDSITHGDADEWRLFLVGRLAETTVRKRCAAAKQFFRFAVRKRLIAESPFDELKSTSLTNPSRFYFLKREDAEKVLEACPDAHWRLLFALARFGGLRVPSEPALLQWEDVNWEQNRITIHSPKTEHHEGGESRLIPLFPELRTLLEDQLELTGDGPHVLPSRIRLHANPGTMLRKIIKRAGLKVWPKLWQNLRSTRQTELSESFPAHVVCAWIGNSEDVAKLHYLQVTDQHFEKALQNPVQTLHGTSRQNSPRVNRAHSEVASSPGKPRLGEHRQCTKVGPTGLEPVTNKL